MDPWRTTFGVGLRNRLIKRALLPADSVEGTQVPCMLRYALELTTMAHKARISTGL